MEEEKIIEKIRNFLEDKEGLDIQGCYFLTKKLNETYWSEVLGEGEEEEIEETGEDEDFGEDAEEPEEYEEIDNDLENGLAEVSPFDDEKEKPLKKKKKLTQKQIRERKASLIKRPPVMRK